MGMLYELEHLRSLIATLETELQRVRQMQYYKSPDCSNERVKTSSRYGAAFEDIQPQVNKIAAKLQKFITRYVTLYNRCIDCILDINDFREQKYLVERFIMGKQEKELLETLDVGKSTLYRIHDRALSDFEKNLKNGT